MVQVIATLAALVVVIGGLTGGLVAIRRWIARVAADAAATRREVSTSNGHTIGGYVESVAGDVTEIKAEIATLTRWATENRDVATSAAALAQHVSARLDAHLSAHGQQPGPALQLAPGRRDNAGAQ